MNTIIAISNIAEYICYRIGQLYMFCVWGGILYYVIRLHKIERSPLLHLNYILS